MKTSAWVVRAGLASAELAFLQQVCSPHATIHIGDRFPRSQNVIEQFKDIRYINPPQFIWLCTNPFQLSSASSEYL